MDGKRAMQDNQQKDKDKNNKRKKRTNTCCNDQILQSHVYLQFLLCMGQPRHVTFVFAVLVGKGVSVFTHHPTRFKGFCTAKPLHI